jgi:hypothetical protein
MLRSYSARALRAKGSEREEDMATKKKAGSGPGKTKAKAKPAKRASAARKAKAPAGSAEGVVYTSVLRELMANRLARG